MRSVEEEEESALFSIQHGSLASSESKMEMLRWCHVYAVFGLVLKGGVKD